MNNIRFDTRVCQYLPDWYKGIAEYQQFCKVETAQMESAEAITKRVYGNFYFSTMDAAGLSEWESIFGIIASPTETLEFRRARLINRLSLKPPFTIRFLRKQLDALIGEGNYNLIVDAGNYTLYVESSASSQAFAIEAAYTINHIKPAHIVYINTPLITEALKINETVEKGNTVYNYRLGAWGLGLLPFASASAMEVIKMASTKSLSNDYLNAFATFGSDDIASVRINGTISITSLTKTVTANQYVVEYTVAPAQTSEIDLIELLDSTGNVLSNATVYIPVPNETRLKHTFIIEEGV